MKNKMYLVQRGRIKDSYDIKYPLFYGISGMISLDNMGAAEYEHGAIYESLKRMTINYEKEYLFAPKDIFILEDSKIRSTDGRVLYVASTSEYSYYEALQSITEYLSSATNGHILDQKRPSYFENAMINLYHDNESCTNLIDWWWDIEQDFIFFLVDPNNDKSKDFKVAFDSTMNFMNEILNKKIRGKFLYNKYVYEKDKI